MRHRVLPLLAPVFLSKLWRRRRRAKAIEKLHGVRPNVDGIRTNELHFLIHSTIVQLTCIPLYFIDILRACNVDVHSTQLIIYPIYHQFQKSVSFIAIVTKFQRVLECFFTKLQCKHYEKSIRTTSGHPVIVTRP